VVARPPIGRRCQPPPRSPCCSCRGDPRSASRGEKITLVLEAIGDDKIRVNSTSLDHPLTILADQAIEIVGIEKKVMVGRTMRSAYWLNHDPSGLVDRL
jgi:hypothetical protein